MGALPFCHLHLQRRRPAGDAYPKQIRTLGDAIRKRRLDLELLQREVADRLGCDVMTIVNWEKNHTSPRITHLERVVEFLGYDPLASGALEREDEQLQAAAGGAFDPRQSDTAGAEEKRTRKPSWAERLVCFRRVRGLTQKRFATEVLKVDPSTLAKWERGEREPKGAFLKRVEAILCG